MPLSPKIYRWFPWAILVLIFFSGLFLRLYQIEKRGISFYDEAFYALEANTFAKIPLLILPLLAERPTDGEAGRVLIHSKFPEGFFPTTTARPGYVFPLAFAMLFDTGSGYAALAFSALVGALTIVAVYLLVHALTGERATGVGAALLMAFLPYHVLYSRIAYPHVLAGLMLTLGVWAYVRNFNADRRTVFRWLFFTGFFLGYAFSTHVNILPLAFLWVLFEAVVAWQKYRSDFWGRMFVFLAGLLLPLLAWQTVLWVKGRIMGAFGSLGLAQSYLGELIAVLYGNNVKGNGFTLHEWKFYFDTLQYLDGTLFVVLVGIAFAVFFLQRASRNIAYVFLFCAVASFILLYSLTSLKATRNLMVIVPLLVSLVALSISALCRRLSSRVAGTVCFWSIIGFSVISFIPSLKTILNLESAYQEAATTFALSPNAVHIGSPWPVFQWHAKNRVFSSYDKDLHSARGGYFAADGTNVTTSPAERAFEEAHRPLRTLPNPVLQFYPLLADVLYGWTKDEILKLIETDVRMGSIRLYTL